MKFLELKKLLNKEKSGGKLLIFMHDFPDPDSLTSALGLKYICEHFNYKVRVVYGGELVRRENQAMVQLLKLKVYFYRSGEEKKYDITALVDTNQYIRNHQFPKELIPDITFDHHSFRNRQPYEKLFDNFFEINHDYGTCSSILLEYLLHYKIPLSVDLATAFCYTMLAETNHFERDYNEVDLKLYRQVIQVADLKTVSKILNVCKPKMYFDALAKGLSKYEQLGSTVICHLGELESIELVHQVADFLMKMEGVKITAATGTAKGTQKICVRSQNSRIHIGNILREALNDYGQGGGHRSMGAGTYQGSKALVIKKFVSLLPKSSIK